MMAHAYAPLNNPPPDLYARWTWLSELQLDWEDVGGRPDPEEVATLVVLVNIQREAAAVKARAQQAGRR